MVLQIRENACAQKIQDAEWQSNKYIPTPGRRQSHQAGGRDRAWLLSGRAPSGHPLDENNVLHVILNPLPWDYTFISPPQERAVPTSSHTGPLHEMRSQRPMITVVLLYIVFLSQDKCHQVTGT